MMMRSAAVLVAAALILTACGPEPDRYLEPLTLPPCVASLSPLPLPTPVPEPETSPVDTDRDGLPDDVDECPTIPDGVDRSAKHPGCPSRAIVTIAGDWVPTGAAMAAGLEGDNDSFYFPAVPSGSPMAAQSLDYVVTIPPVLALATKITIVTDARVKTDWGTPSTYCASVGKANTHYADAAPLGIPAYCLGYGYTAGVWQGGAWVETTPKLDGPYPSTIYIRQLGTPPAVAYGKTVHLRVAPVGGVVLTPIAAVTVSFIATW